MNSKNKKLINIYFIIVISMFIFISLIHIWTALEIGEKVGLTPKEVISLHKTADVGRMYNGYEVLIIQRLSKGQFYFLLGVFVGVYFFVEKIAKKYQKIPNNSVEK